MSRLSFSLVFVFGNKVQDPVWQLEVWLFLVNYIYISELCFKRMHNHISYFKPFSVISYLNLLQYLNLDLNT